MRKSHYAFAAGLICAVTSATGAVAQDLTVPTDSSSPYDRASFCASVTLATAQTQYRGKPVSEVPQDLAVMFHMWVDAATSEGAKIGLSSDQVQGDIDTKSKTIGQMMDNQQTDQLGPGLDLCSVRVPN